MHAHECVTGCTCGFVCFMTLGMKPRASNMQPSGPGSALSVVTRLVSQLGLRELVIRVTTYSFHSGVFSQPFIMYSLIRFHHSR